MGDSDGARGGDRVSLVELHAGAGIVHEAPPNNPNLAKRTVGRSPVRLLLRAPQAPLRRFAVISSRSRPVIQRQQRERRQPVLARILAGHM
jgi:hypothetical protein